MVQLRFSLWPKHLWLKSSVHEDESLLEVAISVTIFSGRLNHAIIYCKQLFFFNELLSQATYNNTYSMVYANNKKPSPALAS